MMRPLAVLSPELSVAAAVFFCVLGVSIALGVLRFRASDRLQTRLARHAVPIASSAVSRSGAGDRGWRTGAENRLGRRVAGLKCVQHARVDLVHANLRIGVGRYYLLRVLIGAVVGAGVQMVSGMMLLSVVAGVIGFLLPRLVLRKVISRRVAAFEGQLAETLDLIVGSLRAGQGLLQAVQSASEEQAEPMRSELRRIVGQVNMGVSVSDAMEGLTARFDSQDVDLLAAAIAINRETGGNLTEVLERLARTVRLRREVRAEARSLTAAPRATSYILAILPMAIASYCVAISPLYREQLLHATLGRMLLIGAVIWSLIGFFISQKLARAEY